MTPAPAASRLDTPQLIEAVTAARLLPVLRAESPESTRRQLELCREVGFELVELTTTCPGWLEALRDILAEPEWAGITVGVGTVVTEKDATDALSAGAAFLVSPYLVPAVRTAAGSAVPLIEGGLSPYELAQASAGNGIAKLFPAASVGPAHLRAVREILPGVAFVPTGGIRADDARSWLDAGAIAVGMGSGLFKMPAGDIAALRRELGAADA